MKESVKAPFEQAHRERSYDDIAQVREISLSNKKISGKPVKGILMKVLQNEKKRGVVMQKNRKQNSKEQK